MLNPHSCETNLDGSFKSMERYQGFLVPLSLSLDRGGTQSEFLRGSIHLLNNHYNEITHTFLLILVIVLVSFSSFGQDINGQQLPDTKPLTAEQIAATPEYAAYQKSMNDYSLAILTMDAQGFEDRLQELSSQGKLILPLRAEQFSSIENAADYANALNNIERDRNILKQKFDWQNLDHDFRMEVLKVYQAANLDVLPNKILNNVGPN